ncbi:MAG TPA: GNAT family N-acetyltransferase [Chitinophagaceae bacterium]|nr:GNAT family N-acetyltransferase [Chitinophagaceae bacterium]
MKNDETTHEGYYIITDNTKMDIGVIHGYLQQSYWAAGVPIDIVKKSVANSLCFGVFHNNAQVGFARLVTDEATFAYLADVFILPAHRGKGLSKWLMQTIHAQPGLQGLRRWMLATRDAHGLYEQFGWTELTGEICKRFMQKHNPDVYKNQVSTS